MIAFDQPSSWCRRTSGRWKQAALASICLLPALLASLPGCALDKQKGSTTPEQDQTAPGRVDDLTFSLVGPTAVTLTWTATGDDGDRGIADSTEIRVAESFITAENWSAATPLTSVGRPGPAGGAETHSITGLATGARYFFALRVWDEVGHPGEISNCADAIPSTSPSPRFNGEVALSATQLSGGMGLVIRCSVRNTGAAAPGGRISLGFPGFDQPGDSARVRASTADDAPGIRVYLPDDTIPDVQCTAMEARHLLLQYEDGTWDTGEVNTIQATVVPRVVGDFIVEVRAALKESAPDTLCDWIGAVPLNGDEGSLDQQGWPVHRFVVTVEDEEISVLPGSFTMGSPAEEPGRRTNEQAHEVTITRAYLLANHEVTQAEWSALMGWNDSGFLGPNRPVQEVTWLDCVRFCNLKSERDGLTPAYVISDEVISGHHLVAATVTWQSDASGFRLPTEAEWEYACRAGTTTPFCNGGLEDLYCGRNAALEAVGWYCGNAAGSTHDVRGLDTNGWGFYDMHGNVWEWCWDRAADYTDAPVTDPSGPDIGAERSFRNGGWFNDAKLCRSAARDHGRPDYRSAGLGFRVARNN